MQQSGHNYSIKTGEPLRVPGETGILKFSLSQRQFRAKFFNLQAAFHYLATLLSGTDEYHVSRLNRIWKSDDLFMLRTVYKEENRNAGIYTVRTVL